MQSSVKRTLYQRLHLENCFAPEAEISGNPSPSEATATSRIFTHDEKKFIRPFRANRKPGLA